MGGGAEMTVKRYLSVGEVGSPPSTNEPLVGRIFTSEKNIWEGREKRVPFKGEEKVDKEKF